MWGGVAEGIGVAVELAVLDGFDFAVDADEGVAEAVEFGATFAFGGFDHEGAGDGPAHGGGVVAVVDEALGDVSDANAGGVFERPDVHDAFVGDEPVSALVEHGKAGASLVAM